MIIMLRAFSHILVLLLLTVFSVGQTSSAAQGGGTVLRLRVRVKVGDATKGLSRKRFFLIKGSLEQNKSVVDELQRRAFNSRDCYYRGAGASEQLINWLRDNDCESVYCRELQPNEVEGAGAIPEFQAAMTAGEKEYGSRELARKWLTTNLPEKLRDGYYKDQQAAIAATIKHAETVSGAKVLSVMTDRNGTAYFTDLEPGVYTLSNILPTEISASSALWNCEIKVKQDDRAFEKPYLISNRPDKIVKCVAVETPLPVCEVMRRPVDR
ncbi:MAG TPA: prealbumin-like fold domain-containing protein [Pyrinomonadaceae bacterium]|nr:prealbumin-like fold domain-containing protein [Pyrinomonadaceae bacterium]